MTSSESTNTTELWNLASQLSEQYRTATVEAVEFWNEIAGWFSEPFNDENTPPEVIADFLMASVNQLSFMQRASGFTKILPELLEQGRLASNAIARVNPTFRTSDPTAFAFAALPETPEAHASLLSDLKSIPEDGAILLVNAATLIMAATSPMVFMRGAFAEYLNKPSLGATALTAIIALVKTIGIDVLAKSCPFIGPAISLAEALHKHETERYERFKTGYKERSAYVRLDYAVTEGLRTLDSTDQIIREYMASTGTVVPRFTEAAGRVIRFFETHNSASV